MNPVEDSALRYQTHGRCGWLCNYFNRETGATQGGLTARFPCFDLYPLHEHPETDQMLVIVGRNHISGMKELLEQQYGFAGSELTPLPTPGR